MSNVTDITPQWTLGDRLKKARRNVKIGSQDMALRLGVSRTTVSNYESGRTTIDAETLGQWCRITGQSSDWILDLTPPTQGDRNSACYEDAKIIKFPSITQAAA